MAKILLPEAVSTKVLEILAPEAVLIQLQHSQQKDVKELIKTCEAIIVIDFPLTAEIISSAPLLCCIAKIGCSTKNIDVTCATERGIPVINTPENDPMPADERVANAVLDILSGGAPINCINMPNGRPPELPVAVHEHHSDRCSCCN